MLAFFVLSFRGICRVCRKNIGACLLLFLGLLIVTFHVFYSVTLGNDLFLIIRFALIASLLLICYFVIPHTNYINLFLFFLTLQAVFLIAFEIYMVWNYFSQDYSEVRNFFRVNEWGDVYTFNGYFWKIQLKGNALIPFALFVSLIYFQGKKRFAYSVLFILAIIVAGNFAFVLGTALFLVLFYFLKNRLTLIDLTNKMTLMSILFLVFLIPVSSYLAEVVQIKSSHSNPVRIDQAVVLMENVGQQPFLGMGFGNLVNKATEFRDYSGSIYYELQALYFINQMGILFFSFFAVLHAAFTLLFIRYKLLIASYLSYILYSLFNPYLLDTNHIVVIVVLVSLKKVMDDGRSLLNTSVLQPKYIRVEPSSRPALIADKASDSL
ncbi:hypothetical protein [Modicisalibacter luteus]|uniref:O-antigen ligase domain-containing protein n=1 Tax=Modicisalibacter luteus TaxID=453962 RepID=A0ABV7M4V3_9GAMM|nr:hypothetical protein [Halomonas lutea]